MSTTATVAIVSGSYTQVSTGSVNVLVKSIKQPFEVYVGTAAPSPNTPATPGLVVNEDDGYSCSLTGLASGADNVYVRACNPAGGTVQVTKS